MHGDSHSERGTAVEHISSRRQLGQSRRKQRGFLRQHIHVLLKTMRSLRFIQCAECSLGSATDVSVDKIMTLLVDHQIHVP
jgi:hypothetical protein